MNKLSSIAILAGLLLTPRIAGAVCSGDVRPDTDTFTDSTSFPGAALTASSPHPTLRRTVVAQSNKVQLASLDNLSSSTSFSAFSTVVNTPNTVRLGDGSYAIFVATQTGWVERWNVDPVSGNASKAWGRWTGRSSCDDGISATPVVHLRSLGTESFQAHFDRDLVYVATRFGGCAGSTTDNQIIAYRVDTGAKVWTFNSGGGVDMDVVYEAPYLDLAEDRIYVGTDNFSGTQDTIWAIDVITGTKAWSQNVGPVWTTPMVRGETIYVGTLAGEIKALNKSDGATLWAIDNGGDPIVTNIFPEFREPYDDLIAAVTLAGHVWMVRDDTWYGSEVWRTTGITASSRVAIDAEFGKVYVGAKNGNIYQLGIVDGSIEASRKVDAGTSTVGDVSFVFESGVGSDVSLIAGSSNGALVKFCGPWAAEVSPAKPNTGLCSSDAACGSTPPTECSTWRCINGTCVAQPVTEGTVCDPNMPYVGQGFCSAGVCIGPTECQGSFAACKCDDYDGGYIRSLHTTPLDCTGLPLPPLPGGDESPFWCTNEVSFAVSQNACIDHNQRTTTPFWVHLFDERRRPFEINPGYGNIVMRIRCLLGAETLCLAFGSKPVFVKPNGAPIGEEVSLGQGTVQASSRRGTYFALLGPDPMGQPYEGLFPKLGGWGVRVTATMQDSSGTCVTNEFPVFSRQLYNAGSLGCGLFSNFDQTGFLRVRVVDSNDVPVVGAEVQVGYAKDKKFAKNFEESITNNPNEPNWGYTNTNGYINFVDHGNYMNGPTHVFATCPGKPFGDEYTAPKPSLTKVGPDGELQEPPVNTAHPIIVLDC